jgi:hypothetical protein
MTIKIWGGGTSHEDDRQFQKIKLMQELAAMPEYELYKELEGLSTSVYILDGNFSDLRRQIHYLTTDPKTESLFFVRNRDKLNWALRDVIRLIHNYVAASLSLIDHTRRLYDKLYANTGKFDDYQMKIQTEFAQDPLAQFVKGLRQHFQHYKAPNLGINSFQNKAGKIIKTIDLYKSDLLLFDSWGAVAKAYLEKVHDQVNVITLMTKYQSKVSRFYLWFQTRQEEIHKDEFERLKSKDDEFHRLLLEDSIDMGFAKSVQGIPHRTDDIFLSIFRSAQFDELEKIPRDSPQRPLCAIELLEKHFFQIPQETKERILALYKLPDILPSSSSNQ